MQTLTISRYKANDFMISSSNSKDGQVVQVEMKKNSSEKGLGIALIIMKLKKNKF